MPQMQRLSKPDSQKCFGEKEVQYLYRGTRHSIFNIRYEYRRHIYTYNETTLERAKRTGKHLKQCAPSHMPAAEKVQPAEAKPARARVGGGGVFSAGLGGVGVFRFFFFLTTGSFSAVGIFFM